MTSSEKQSSHQQPRQISSNSKWFHHIDGPTAENLLMQHGVEGSFLARPSASTNGDYTLSVRRDSQVTHVKIQSNGEFFDLYGGDKFATLQELVEHYMNNFGAIKEMDGRVIELKHPLINEENLPLHDQRGAYTPWFHKHITGVMAEQMLKEKGKQGSFLVRSSTNQTNALILCALVDQQVLHIRIYYTPNDGYDVGGGQKFESLPELVEFYRRTPMVDKSGTLVHLKQPLNATRMTASQIGARIKELEQGFQHSGFWEEFEELQRELDQGQGNERSEGSRPENKAKNRFKNILPFDRTRVVLNDCDKQDPNFGDYINANYIRPDVSFPGSRNYIATQGPLPSTLSDFWRMVWQENSRIVVMATKEEERSVIKCARYWPTKQDTQEFQVMDGAIIVKHIEETAFGDYTVNRLMVKREPGSEIREVLHYQYVSWPDNNVPQDPMSVLKLLQDVDKKAKEMEKAAGGPLGPAVVHCSTGIGRTGSVIIIDMLLNFINAHGLNCDIDVQKLTHHVRAQRSGMVQTEGQYKFVYKAVQAFIEQQRRQQQQQQQQQQPQQQQTPVNGHDYTNLPPIGQQPPPAAASAPDAPVQLRAPKQLNVSSLTPDAPALPPQRQKLEPQEASAPATDTPALPPPRHMQQPPEASAPASADAPALPPPRQLHQSQKTSAPTPDAPTLPPLRQMQQPQVSSTPASADAPALPPPRQIQQTSAAAVPDAPVPRPRQMQQPQAAAAAVPDAPVPRPRQKRQLPLLPD